MFQELPNNADHRNTNLRQTAESNKDKRNKSRLKLDNKHHATTLVIIFWLSTVFQNKFDSTQVERLDI